MKPCVSIKSFCDTLEKQKILLNCINKIKAYNYQIILHAAYNVPKEISDSVDFYLYYRNSIYAEKNITYFWRSFNEGVFKSFTQDYGYAEMKQIFDVANFAKNHGFSIVHTLNYDIDISQFSIDHLKEHEDYLNSDKEVCFHTAKENYAGLLFYSYKPEAIQRINIESYEDWRKCVVDEPYLAENGFYRMFTQLNYKVTKKNFHFNDLVRTPFLDFSSLPEFIESAGIYRRSDGDYTLLIIFKDKTNSILLIDEKVYKIVSTFTCIKLLSYPRKVLLKNNTETIEIFPDWKMIAMKETLEHDV
jgi:hypothetical protein